MQQKKIFTEENQNFILLSGLCITCERIAYSILCPLNTKCRFSEKSEHILLKTGSLENSSLSTFILFFPRHIFFYVSKVTIFYT